MLDDWDILPDNLQLVLSQEALRRAAVIIAEQVEALAAEMASGGLRDFGGVDALNLSAGLVRLNGRDDLEAFGTA